LSRVVKTMDGNEAAATVSYAFTEVATIYPITPSSPMAELVDIWSSGGRKNLLGQPVSLVEMQSEAGAVGAMHGSLEAGALTTSYTASQGLLLMIPTLYRIAGERMPAVLHVSARTVGTHSLSIFGDHSDVMACRQTGVAMLCSASVQEIMHLAGVAHLAALDGEVPFIHFFDGFRTSHEIQKIGCLTEDELRSLMSWDALERFRKRALNPEHPVQRGMLQNGDVFFQTREASNAWYNKLPETVQKYMDKINLLTGLDYRLFNYYGAPDADRVVIAMGSVCGTIRQTVDCLNAKGEKTGLLQVHLYRPFSTAHFLAALPLSVKRVAVLDRTKEPGSAGEPLYQDVCATLMNQGRAVSVYGGRYGLSSKDVDPSQILAVFLNLKQAEPKNRFTVGIIDDVTGLSLPLSAPIDLSGDKTISCKFWGLGSDGTVGANKNSIKIIGDHTDLYVQAYFEYDSKKSGGVTKSHLRFGPDPIDSSYLVKQAEFVACHSPTYIEKYDIICDVKPGGVFLFNCGWDVQELEYRLPGHVKRELKEKNIRFYIIDATRIAREIGLGSRTNTVLQAAFFQLSRVIDPTKAVEWMKAAIEKTYRAKGEKILNMNYQAVERGMSELRQVEVPDSWLGASDAPVTENADLPSYVREIMQPINRLQGDSLPVSTFLPVCDGASPLGTTKYERRGVAVDVPRWAPENCIQCNLCSLVCPHASIRPYLLTEAEAEAAPRMLQSAPAVGRGLEGLRFVMQVDPMDCAGCSSCAQVCPAKRKALVMEPIDSQKTQMEAWEYCLNLPQKKNPLDKYSVKGSQLEQPLLEFSGACAGCGETPYMKLMTQLFGDRMYVANGTGCTQAWGSPTPNIPYTVNRQGCGPAWTNSLFENNAELCFGMLLSVTQQRARLRLAAQRLHEITASDALKDALSNWLDHFDEKADSSLYSKQLKEALRASGFSGEAETLRADLLNHADQLQKKSFWMYGGDGWAYDIGYGGLDHVLAMGPDVNILVVDTEVYSNTGGQSSKATPLGAVAQFAAAGKRTGKKDLGMQAISYGHVYVAQVALGADPAQLVRVLKEAESYPGPSLVIAYAPCINHGIVKGMGYSQAESKLAVQSGYWPLYHFDPRRKEQGLNPFVLDSKAPTVPLREFLLGEVRYAALARTFPDQAEALLKAAEKAAAERFLQYQKRAAE